MSTRSLAFAWIVILAGCAGTSGGMSDAPVGSYPSDLPREEVLEEMAEYATPGAEHARLAKLAGTWDLSVRVRWGGENEWHTGSGTSEFRPILGGRYVLEEVNATLAGRPLHALVVHGYDRLQERWFAVWFDESSTWPTYMSGTEDESGTITRSGRIFDVVTPSGRPFTVTMQTEGDRLASHVFDTIDGESVEVMQIYRTPRSGK
jgi:hypothetical protein